jgi:DNA-binding IclR family transcriptional regulator
MRAAKTPSAPALQRGLAILERIAKSRRGLTFAQLTRHFDVAKSSVHTLVLTLEREGYLQRDDVTGRYMTGQKLVQIAGMTLDGLVLRERATPLLRSLVTETGMTAHLAILDRDEVTVVAKIDRPGTHRIATWVGKRMDVHCTSLGKCLIAHLSEEEVNRLIADRGLLRHNENTIVSLARLKLELARTRALGYALDDEEEELGWRCIGAPVCDRDGRVIAAVSVAGSIDRINADTIEEIAAQVRAAAAGISRELGYWKGNESDADHSASAIGELRLPRMPAATADLDGHDQDCP